MRTSRAAELVVRQSQRIHSICIKQLLSGSPPPSWDYGAAREWIRFQKIVTKST